MTLDMILRRFFGHETTPYEPIGEWYVTTAPLANRSIKELQAQITSGAVVLGSRKSLAGLQEEEEIGLLLLWGTPEQLASAQETLKLQPLVDAMLEQPEPHWG